MVSNFVKLILASLTLVCIAGCRPTAQIGNDESTFNTVDALYTAVCAKRADLVNQCERDLQSLQAAERIPAPAYDSLTQIIAQTRLGDWRPAAEKLSRFMSNQRRTL